MALEVSDQKYSLRIEAQNLVVTILFSLLPLILVALLDSFLPITIIIHFVGSIAILFFCIWVLEVIGAILVPTEIIALSRVLSTTYGNLDGRPAVFMLIDERFEKQTDLALEEVFRIETYPQGEVVKIKDRVSEQMRIIDALA